MTVHAFRDFELDEDRFELRRAGSAVRVEPRVLEVLAHLVRNRGRIVSKEELLDQVWKKTFVSESALTRCIMEGRRAIGDQDRSEPLIRTVHGRGYRFECPDDVAMLAPLVPVVAEVPPVRTEAVPAEVVPLANSVPPRPPRLLRLAAVLVILLGVAFAFGMRPAPVLPITRIALLPISSPDWTPEGGRELQLVGMSITDLLEQRLSKMPRVRVRGVDYSGPLSNDVPTLSELARRAGVDRIVSGNARLAGGGAHIELTLHEVQAGGVVRDTPIGAFEIPLLRHSADIRHYAALRDRVVARVVDTLAPAFDNTPQDFEAYRLYLLARERLASGTCDGEAAVELLRRSIEIDPNFAPAWDAYGWAHYRLSYGCGRGSRYQASALEGAQRALRLSPGLGSPVALQGRVMIATGRVAEAHRMLRAAVRKQPHDQDLQFSLATALLYSGSIAEARAVLDRLRTADPSYFAQRGVAPMAYLYAGDTTAFLSALPTAEAPLFLYQRGFAELMRGQRQAAWRALEPAFRLNPSDPHARLSQALMSIIEGQPTDAREILRQLTREREVLGSADGEMTYRLAQLYALSGDGSAALRELSRSVDQGFACTPCMERDPAMSSVRNEDGFGRALVAARTRQSILN